MMRKPQGSTWTGVRHILPWRRMVGIATLAAGLGWGAALLPAQIVAGASVGIPAAKTSPHLATLSGQAQIGVALPPVPHLLLMWNLATVGFDRLERRNGGFLSTGIEAWVSPSLLPALSHGLVLLGDADIGRRFGPGLHGFTSLGAGAGWSFGSWVPYVEFRRRLGFHAGRQPDRQILIGFHFVLFG